MPVDPHRRTAHALYAGELVSHQLGLTYSMTALLKSWALTEPDLHRASALTAEVAATADRDGRGLMSMSLTPHQRCLRVAVDEPHAHDGDDRRDPSLTVHVTETPERRTTFVVARQRGADEQPIPNSVVRFSLSVAGAQEDGAVGTGDR